MDHILSGCEQLAKREYLERHNKVASYLHWHICKAYNCPVPGKWYEHTPQEVTNAIGKKTTILYDSQVHTDRTIKANKPDIVIRDNTAKKCWMIDVSVPADHNVVSKEAEKMLKYKDLAIEVSRMWHTSVTVVPVIVGALGTTSKEHEKWIEEIPGNASVVEIQRSVLYGSAHILRRVLG